MADPLSAASGILTLVGFALQSSSALYQTIQSFRSSKRNVRELKEELEALTGVLQSLHDVARSSDADFTALTLPLRRCGSACSDFEALLAKCSQHSNVSRTSFRDWAKLSYMGGDIAAFKNMLTAYKSIIIIALGDANLRTSIVTANVLQEYKQVIENTTSDLEDHLEEVDRKLKSLQSQGKNVSIEETAQRRKIQEEIVSTQKCLDICAKVSFHIDEVQPSVFENLSTPSNADQGPITSLEGLILARSTTNNALEQCKGMLTDTSTKLQRHLRDVNDRLKDLGSEPQDITDEQRAERDRIEEELNSTKQGLAICTQASEEAGKERVNVFEDVRIAEAGHQVIVSTIGDLILARRVSAGNRSTQWMGQMSDASLQQLASVLGQTALDRVTDQQAGAASNFESRYGTGFKLSPEKSTEAGARSD